MLLGFYHENLEKILYFELSFIKTESNEVKEESEGTGKSNEK